MVEKIIDLIVIADFIGLFVLVAAIRSWQKKQGRLTEKKIALILTGYWTFFTITASYPIYSVNFQVGMVVDIVLLLGFWGIGYPFTRWLYRKFTSLNK
jgi:hypothetical protein